MSELYPTTHALERIKLRFGIPSEKAAEWINEKMKRAKLVTVNGNKTLVYEADNARFVIDGKKNAVITVHHTLRTDFLRPALEREMRKIKRESTRQTRELERRLAKAYALLSERMMNYANARNPQTRELISERIDDVNSYINELESEIERLNDETQAKLRAIELIAE